MPNSGWLPSYLRLAATGELEARAQALEAMLENCCLCPRACRVDRRVKVGSCSTGVEAKVASFGPHHGEEPVISGRRGSGTVFLANCNLACIFCQNSDVSQRPQDYLQGGTSADELASMFLTLQGQGCHNLNWVSPTHQVPMLVRALLVAAEHGLRIPVVYNSNGYDSVAPLRLLEGVVDVYMPDLKYSDPAAGEELSGVPDYPQRARETLPEMFRQVGETWRLDPDGTLERGLLVRLLVLPSDRAGVEESLSWLAHALSPRVAVSLLAQYRPSHQVRGSAFPALQHPLSPGEWSHAVASLQRHLAEGRHHHVQGAARVRL